MYRVETGKEVFSIYSIYSFSSCNWRKPNCQSYPKLEKPTPKTFFDKIITSANSFILFIGFCVHQVCQNKVLANWLSLSINYWNLCYFICGYAMSQKFNEKEHRSYQVVEILKNDMMDDQTSDESNADRPASAQTKTKRSLFATLIKRKHTKPKMKITKKIETCSTINFSTDSSAVPSQQELARYEFSTELDKHQSKSANKIKQYNFFKKIIKRTNSCNSKKNSGLTTKDNCCGDSNTCDNDVKRLTLNFFASAYIPKCNIKLINGINELQSILHNLYHSEQHMVYLLKKFVEDKSTQKQLFDASWEYFALQYDSKCQVNVLADKMWHQQTEINKMQDYHLQKRLNYLVKTNRTLETQIENLSRHCEKLAARTNLYPKRFLHMRSFGKTYARQLIDNNRKLQKKSQALTEVITDFEEELQKLQHRKEVLEEEKRNLRSRVYNLEGALEKEENEREIEKSGFLVQINHQNSVFKDSVTGCQYIFKDLNKFEHELRDLAIKVIWPNLQFQDGCLPEMILHIRTCFEELFLTMVSAYRNVVSVAKDVSKLRSTNARLQENLQKSTSELDNLSKRFEKKSDLDFKGLESLCRRLEDENLTLKININSKNEEKKILSQEVELKSKNLEESKASLNELLLENKSLSSQMDGLIMTLSQMQPDQLSKEFRSSQEKLDYLKLRCGQIVSDQKNLLEKCSSLDDENQHMLEAQDAYQQDIVSLQEGLSVLTNENDVLKKQLAMEHQTNERLKYLEEKNLLKTVFQHLKSEVSRIQQLEGAVADMSKETNRLSLIAEFNKQLGEQLKAEVEVKDHTIAELRESLEKLSHIQLDNDKEKMTLCARLSEILSVKEKLSDCLEVELQKNLKLDESRKKLETTTKSQLKIYEEMQKNERAALKELLKDFKNLIKQRDCLVNMQEDSKKCYKELEKRFIELKKQFESVSSQKHKKEEEMQKLVTKLEEQEEQMRQQEEKLSSTEVKYEKNIKKLEKLLGQIRDEKSALETSNTFLKTTIQKLQTDLDEARENITSSVNKVSVKAAETATLETELINCRNDLQKLSQENGKLIVEIEYLKKMNDQLKQEHKDTISQFSNKDTKYLESQTVLLSKDHQISELNKAIIEKENEIKKLQQDCGYLKKQTEDQNKVLSNYEDQLVMMQEVESSKIKLEKEMSNLQLENRAKMTELENAAKEIETLKNQIKSLILKSETERSYYHNQTNEIFLEYSEQKANIEEEIDSISSQLHVVTENLHKEKIRFDQLTKAHEDLQLKYTHMKETYNSELIAHKEAMKKIESLEGFMKTISTERESLQQQVHLLLNELNEEKNSHNYFCNETKKIQQVLEQGKQQYATLQNRNKALEEELKELKMALSDSVNAEKTLARLEEKNSDLKSAKETIASLKKELDDSQKTLSDLKEDFFKLQQQVTGLEFKNCELTLQLHETQGKLETERNLLKELKAAKTPSDSERTPPLAPSEHEELFY